MTSKTVEQLAYEIADNVEQMAAVRVEYDDNVRKIGSIYREALNDDSFTELVRGLAWADAGHEIEVGMNGQFRNDIPDGWPTSIKDVTRHVHETRERLVHRRVDRYRLDGATPQIKEQPVSPSVTRLRSMLK